MSEQNSRDANKTPVSKPVVILGTGGTGGHVFPAEAIARELIRLNYDVVMITDVRGRRFIDDLPEDVRVYDLPNLEMSRGIFRKIAACFGAVSALFKTKDIFEQALPRFTICFGGSATLPVALAARLSGVPLYLHEQNAVVGRMNRWLCRLLNVRVLFYSFSSTRYLPDIRSEHVGNPVRPVVREARREPYPIVDLRTRLRFLVLGGSQGALIMGAVVPQAIQALPEDYRRRIFVLHQARPEDIEAVREAYDRAGVSFEVRRFIHNIGEELTNAHMVITRAGASTIAELTTVGRPAVLVPYPHATDNHQLYNAKAMSDREAGWLFSEEHFTARNLAVHLRALIEVPTRLGTSAQCARHIGIPDAAVSMLRRIENDLPSDKRFK